MTEDQTTNNFYGMAEQNNPDYLKESKVTLKVKLNYLVKLEKNFMMKSKKPDEIPLLSSMI